MDFGNCTFGKLRIEHLKIDFFDICILLYFHAREFPAPLNRPTPHHTDSHFFMIPKGPLLLKWDEMLVEAHVLIIFATTPLCPRPPCTVHGVGWKRARNHVANSELPRSTLTRQPLELHRNLVLTEPVKRKVMVTSFDSRASHSIKCSPNSRSK